MLSRVLPALCVCVCVWSVHAAVPDPVYELPCYAEIHTGGFDKQYSFPSVASESSMKFAMDSYPEGLDTCEWDETAVPLEFVPGRAGIHIPNQKNYMFPWEDFKCAELGDANGARMWNRHPSTMYKVADKGAGIPGQFFSGLAKNTFDQDKMSVELWLSVDTVTEDKYEFKWCTDHVCADSYVNATFVRNCDNEVLNVNGGVREDYGPIYTIGLLMQPLSEVADPMYMSCLNVLDEATYSLPYEVVGHLGVYQRNKSVIFSVASKFRTTFPMRVNFNDPVDSSVTMCGNQGALRQDQYMMSIEIADVFEPHKLYHIILTVDGDNMEVFVNGTSRGTKGASFPTKSGPCTYSGTGTIGGTARFSALVHPTTPSSGSFTQPHSMGVAYEMVCQALDSTWWNWDLKQSDNRKFWNALPRWWKGGNIYKVAMYDVVLQSSDIAALYGAGPPRSPPVLSNTEQVVTLPFDSVLPMDLIVSGSSVDGYNAISFDGLLDWMSGSSIIYNASMAIPVNATFKLLGSEVRLPSTPGTWEAYMSVGIGMQHPYGSLAVVGDFKKVHMKLSTASYTYTVAPVPAATMQNADTPVNFTITHSLKGWGDPGDRLKLRSINSGAVIAYNGTSLSVDGEVDSGVPMSLSVFCNPFCNVEVVFSLWSGMYNSYIMDKKMSFRVNSDIVVAQNVSSCEEEKLCNISLGTIQDRVDGRSHQFVVASLPAHGKLYYSGAVISAVPYTVPVGKKVVQYAGDVDYVGADAFWYYAKHSASSTRSLSNVMNITLSNLPDPPAPNVSVPLEVRPGMVEMFTLLASDSDTKDVDISGYLIGPQPNTYGTTCLPWCGFDAGTKCGIRFGTDCSVPVMTKLGNLNCAGGLTDWVIYHEWDCTMRMCCSPSTPGYYYEAFKNRSVMYRAKTAATLGAFNGIAYRTDYIQYTLKDETDWSRTNGSEPVHVMNPLLAPNPSNLTDQGDPLLFEINPCYYVNGTCTPVISYNLKFTHVEHHGGTFYVWRKSTGAQAWNWQEVLQSCEGDCSPPLTETGFSNSTKMRYDRARGFVGAMGPFSFQVVSFNPVSDTSGPATYSFVLKNVNDGPLFVLASPSVHDKTWSKFELVMSDPDPLTDDMTLKLEASFPLESRFVLSPPTVPSGLNVTGNNTYRIELQGSLADINSTLPCLKYRYLNTLDTTFSNYKISETITVSGVDKGTGGGTPLAFSKSLSLDIVQTPPTPGGSDDPKSSIPVWVWGIVGGGTASVFVIGFILTLLLLIIVIIIFVVIVFNLGGASTTLTSVLGGVGFKVIRSKTKVKKIVLPPPPPFGPIVYGDPAGHVLSGGERQLVPHLGALQKLLLEQNLGLVHVVMDVTQAAAADKLAKAMVHVFDSVGTAETMRLLLQSVSREVKLAENSGTLFRSNSFASKMLKVYSKMIGLPYIYRTLGLVILEIATKETGLEVDPNKVDAADEETDVDVNKWKLLATAQKCLSAILKSKNQIPTQFRQICHHLQTEVISRFPENKHTAVGGFLFLRFYVPVITSPDGFGILKDPPEPATRRLLVLVAKTLQNLSNGTQFREKYMENMNAFIRSNIEHIEKFFDDVASAPANLPPPVPSEKMPKNVKEIALLHVYRHIHSAQAQIGTRLDAMEESWAQPLKQRITDICREIGDPPADAPRR